MDKMMCKLELLCVKYIPILIAAIVLLNAILNYFNIYVKELHYIAGTSFLTLIPMYISSYAYKFCEYHRMFIHYTTITWILNIIDLYIGIPVSDIWYLGIQLIIAGISLFIILYLYVKSYKKPTIKDSR